MIKKIFLWCVAACLLALNVAQAVPPTFDQQIGKPLTTDNSGNDETVISPNAFGIDPNKTFKENIYNLFSPLNDNSVIRRTLRTIMVGVLVLYIAWAGIDMMQHAADETRQKRVRRSFLYIWVGAFMIRWATWILGTALQVGTVQGTQWLVSNLQNNVLFQILAFLKGLAFFYAIVMLIYYGFQFMRALEEESKIKAARTGLINVIVALVLIKIIDFIFFIAQQQDFGSRLQNFLVDAARIAAYVLWAGMVLALIRGGVRYLTSQGDEEKVKDAQKIITTIFFIILTIFLFLLVVYQLVAEFT